MTKTPDITLYGTTWTGAGWLALLPPHGRLLGNGEPRKDVSFTAAVWTACYALADAGYHGPATVYDAGGERMATIDVDSPGWYGDLKWGPATVFTISGAALEAHR